MNQNRRAYPVVSKEKESTHYGRAARAGTGEALNEYPASSLGALPENCRNQSGTVMTCCDNLSAGVSSFSINNRYLQTSECLREAGAGGSNPLTPTNSVSSPAALGRTPPLRW